MRELRRIIFEGNRVSVSEITSGGSDASEAFLETGKSVDFYYSSGVGGMERVSIRRGSEEVLTEVFADAEYAKYL